MAMDSLSIWKEEFADLPVTDSAKAGAKAQAEFIDERVTKKLSIGPTPAKFTPEAKFTWQKSIFEKAVLIIYSSIAPDPITPKIAIAAAWKTATLASTMIIESGAKLSPPIGNGTVAAALAVIDPITLAKAEAGLAKDLIAGALVKNAKDSAFPTAFFKAFNSITYTITGTDTTAPTPVPITLPLTPVK